MEKKRAEKETVWLKFGEYDVIKFMGKIPFWCITLIFFLDGEYKEPTTTKQYKYVVGDSNGIYQLQICSSSSLILFLDNHIYFGRIFMNMFGMLKVMAILERMRNLLFILFRWRRTR